MIYNEPSLMSQFAHKQGNSIMILFCVFVTALLDTKNKKAWLSWPTFSFVSTSKQNSQRTIKFVQREFSSCSILDKISQMYKM
jgi:hypothetical protein